MLLQCQLLATNTRPMTSMILCRFVGAENFVGFADTICVLPCSYMF